MFDIKKYWERIAFAPVPGESKLEQLIRIHRCHIYHIPFEDLNPFCKIPVSLEPDAIYSKVIEGKRGGYCFELNQLFQKLLDEMGYETMAVFCRPFSGEGVKLALTHRMTAVFLDGKIWLCDIGLGGNCWIEPLILDVEIEQLQYGRNYSITQSGNEYLVQWKQGEAVVKALTFSLSPAVESDFIMSNYYTSSHPTSPFVNRLMCVIPTENGRCAIRDRIFKEERDGTVTETELTGNNWKEILSKYFGIELETDMCNYIDRYLEKSPF